MSSHPSFPRIPLSPSPICLGTGDLGAAISREDSLTLLDAYVDHGGNFLDTAKVYSDWIPGESSRSEKIIGEWMKQRGKRARIVLATKGAHPDLAAMHIPRLSRGEIEADLHASLQHLQTDVIDLYWLHRDDPARPVEDILATLNDALKAGKIRAFGCSNWRVERLREANAFAAQHGLSSFVAIQVLWNLAVVDWAAIGDPTIVTMDSALWEYHRQTGLAAIPFSATANGLFNKLERGAVNRGSAEPRSVSALNPLHQKMYAAPENLRRYERAHQLALQKGLRLTQVVLGYLLSQPFPTFPIIGPKTVVQLLDSLTAMEVRLSVDEVKFLTG